MKNQYFGDVGDYGKYGLLRFLANNHVKIAVNWYLTPDDGSNDGKHISYLDSNKDRRYDPGLFDLLKAMVKEGERSIPAFEKKDVIPGAIYYDELLTDEGNSREEKKKSRDKWHKKALETCAGADLVFLDPDNGACEQVPFKTKDSIKYCYADEIADYYNAGQNVVYYCQKGRRTYEQWEETKTMMKRKLPDSRIAAITFHRGTQRSYIFVLHKESFRAYSGMVKRFLWTWTRIFSEECGEIDSWSGGKTGEKFHVTSSTGVELTIEECEDGWVEIKKSDERNVCCRMSIDNLISRL